MVCKWLKGVRMVGTKEVGVKGEDEMRGLITVSNAGDTLHDAAVGIEGNGRRIQETGNGGFRIGKRPVKWSACLTQQSQSQQICLTSALEDSTCPILLRLVTRTTSRTMAPPSIRCAVIPPSNGTINHHDQVPQGQQPHHARCHEDHYLFG